MPNSPIIYRIAPSAIDAEQPVAALRHAADVLRSGGLVAFPTETVYGLGANALDPVAVARIFAAKGRPANNPLIVHLARIEQARDLAAHWPAAAERLAARFWPGPLTLVVPRASVVPEIVTAGAATVALRIPAHPVARALLDVANLPIAAPSANRSNQVSPTKAEHVVRGLGAAVDVVIDGGPASGGLESTVLDISGDIPRILRPGLVRRDEIESLIGPVARDRISIADSAAAMPSPGTGSRHYAPRAPMECCDGSGQSRVELLLGEGLRVGWLALGSNSQLPPHPRPLSREGKGEQQPQAVIIRIPNDVEAYAARLYAALHELDEAAVERIVVDLPPDEEAWHAVRDRLQRGAAK